MLAVESSWNPHFICSIFYTCILKKYWFHDDSSQHSFVLYINTFFALLQGTDLDFNLKIIVQHVKCYDVIIRQQNKCSRF